MRILCWNLGAAYGRWRDEPRLHDRAWHWIAALDPDIACLQETRPPAWVTERWKVQHGHYESFASALISRPGLDLSPMQLPVDGALERFGAYLATAELSLDGGGSLIVASVHTSARAARESGHPGMDRSAIARLSVGEPWWNDVAFAGFRELLAGRRFLVAGDWNTARWIDEVGVPNPPGLEFFDRAASVGWVDVTLGPDGREGKTWFGSPNPRPYQPDHAFADPLTAALIRSFRIEPWPVVSLGLSDHAPFLIDIDLELAQRIPTSSGEATTGPDNKETDDGK
jgi:exonuclease III